MPGSPLAEREIYMGSFLRKNWGRLFTGLPEALPYLPMFSRNSVVARSLEPLAAGLWTLFVIVSVVVAAVWTLDIGEGSIERVTSNPDLRAALAWMLSWLDFGWITLAAANVYMNVVSTVGLATARCWALVILGAVLAMAWVSTATGFPLGPIRYGSALGLKLGPVPVGLLLLWLSVVLGAREAILFFRPRWGQAPIAVTAGVLAALMDMSLEPLAAKFRGFWFWAAAAPGEPPVYHFPLTGSLAWGMLAGGLVFCLREKEVVDSATKRPWQPLAVLVIFEAVFLLAGVTPRF